MLGLTLAEPRAVAFEPAKTPAGTTVRLALPDLPVLQVTFEEKTGLPVRVEHHPVENHQRLHKVFVMSEHKPAGGLLLPSKLEFTQNDTLADR